MQIGATETICHRLTKDYQIAYRITLDVHPRDGWGHGEVLVDWIAEASGRDT